MINWGKYLNSGLIKKQKPNFYQIAKQIKRAEKDLLTFQLVIETDPEWAATIAYQAMLRVGRALMFAYGYLPSNGQQHKTVVEVTGIILGEKYKITIRQFDRFRKKRNIFFYDSEDTQNKTEAKTALQTATQLLQEIKSKLNMLDPQKTFTW